MEHDFGGFKNDGFYGSLSNSTTDNSNNFIFYLKHILILESMYNYKNLQFSL